MIETAEQVIERFEKAARAQCSPEHVDICVAAFRVGVECGTRPDVKGSEMDALESLVLAIFKGFESGIRVRRGLERAAITDAGEIG